LIEFCERKEEEEEEEEDDEKFEIHFSLLPCEHEKQMCQK
jgi:hypothetical protein